MAEPCFGKHVINGASVLSRRSRHRSAWMALLASLYATLLPTPMLCLATKHVNMYMAFTNWMSNRTVKSLMWDPSDSSLLDDWVASIGA
jgi:hypothetical protein